MVRTIREIGGFPEWVTDDLLEKIESHPLLSKAFRDPSLSQVLAEFQRNPEAMLKAAQGNQEMMQFLQEFSLLMGGHFAALSGKNAQGSKTAPEGKLITEACTSSNCVRVACILNSIRCC